MKKSKETITPPARVGGVFKSDGSLKLPDPVLTPSAKDLEEKRARLAASVESDPLPTDFKEALKLQQVINRLPDKTPGKKERLYRIGRHVTELQQGPMPPPPMTLTQLHNHFFPKATEDQIATARKQLLGQTKRK